MRSFCMSGFSDALDWRPLFFKESFIAQSACALCGVLSRKAVRLSCDHTLCSECHEESERRGEACPLDEVSFADDSFVRLEVSGSYIEKRTVACWNASRGCNFEGPISLLLGHYKDCTFHVVSCPRCQTLVQRSDIVRHCKDGCSVSRTAVELDNNPFPDYDHIQRTSRNLRESMLKISEDFSCLQTSLNQCHEEIRTVDKSIKLQLEAQYSRLFEQLVRLLETSPRALCPQIAEGKLSGFAETIESRVKAHMTHELRAQNGKLMNAAESVCDFVFHLCGPKEFQWHFRGWEAFKQRALDTGRRDERRPFLYVSGYRLSQSIMLSKKEEQLGFGMYASIHPGAYDSKLEWPFRETCTIGLVHPQNKEKRVILKFDASMLPDHPAFQWPNVERGNVGYGLAFFCTAEKLESDGFVMDDSLRIFLQVDS